MTRLPLVVLASRGSGSSQNEGSKGFRRSLDLPLPPYREPGISVRLARLADLPDRGGEDHRVEVWTHPLLGLPGSFSAFYRGLPPTGSSTLPSPIAHSPMPHRSYRFGCETTHRMTRALSLASGETLC